MRIHGTASTWRREWLLLFGASLGLLVLAQLIVGNTDGSPQHGVLISLATITAVKFFGSRRGDSDEDVQGEHPVVRMIFQGANTGEFDDVEDLVAGGFKAYANGYEMSSSDVDQGPALLIEAIDYWRDAVPDVRWELYDEVSQKEHKTEDIAFRFVSGGTIGGEERQIEVAAFAKVVDKQLAEARFVLDMTALNEYRAAVGLPPIE